MAFNNLSVNYINKPFIGNIRNCSRILLTSNIKIILFYFLWFFSFFSVVFPGSSLNIIRRVNFVPSSAIDNTTDTRFLSLPKILYLHIFCSFKFYRISSLSIIYINDTLQFSSLICFISLVLIISLRKVFITVLTYLGNGSPKYPALLKTK